MMKSKLIALPAAALLAVFSATIAPARAAADAAPVKIKLAPMPGIGHLIPELAIGLGYFKEEGLDVEMVNVMNWIPDDFYSSRLLNNGTVDCEINWYQRIYYGIGNGEPLKGVFRLEDSPHMTISVVNRLKDQIHTAKDFKGHVIADSEGFSTKRYLTDTIIRQNGLQITDYTPAPGEWSSKYDLLTKAIKENKVDIVSSMEPMTSKLLAAHLITPIYDLTTHDGTVKALGNIWLARCLFFSPKYIAEHPDRVQKMVNAFTKTMRWLNAHTADEVFAKLNQGYFAPDINNDFYADYKAGKKDEVEKAYQILAQGDYSFPPATVKMVCNVIAHTDFDESDEGQYRRKAAQSGIVKPEDTYDNTFVEAAMAANK